MAPLEWGSGILQTPQPIEKLSRSRPVAALAILAQCPTPRADGATVAGMTDTTDRINTATALVRARARRAELLAELRAAEAEHTAALENYLEALRELAVWDGRDPHCLWLTDGEGTRHEALEPGYALTSSTPYSAYMGSSSAAERRAMLGDMAGGGQ